MTPHHHAHRVLRKKFVLSTPFFMHQPRSWSKAEAPSNILCMLVAPEVSHAPRSWLKVEAE